MGPSHWALPGEADKVWKLRVSVLVSLPARVCPPLSEEWLLPTHKGKVLLCLELEGFQGACSFLIFLRTLNHPKKMAVF